MRASFLTFAATAFVLVACGGQSGQPATTTAQKPPGPKVEYQARWDKLTPSGPFDEVEMIVDFAPGAWTSVHSHGGPGFVMVVTGEVTKRANGSETVYRAGQTWHEEAGEVHQAGNARSSPARAVAVVLLPKGAAITTDVAGASKPAIPATVSKTTLNDPGVTSPLDQVRMVLDFAPGAWTPVHMHGGPALITVLEGEMTLRQGGVDKVFKAGENWTEAAGQVHQAGNLSGAKTRVVSNYLVSSGAQVTTVVRS
jgi:quercetin dioxygenase-like cupin family protein